MTPDLLVKETGLLVTEGWTPDQSPAQDQDPDQVQDQSQDLDRDQDHLDRETVRARDRERDRQGCGLEMARDRQDPDQDQDQDQETFLDPDQGPGLALAGDQERGLDQGLDLEDPEETAQIGQDPQKSASSKNPVPGEGPKLADPLLECQGPTLAPEGQDLVDAELVVVRHLSETALQEEGLQGESITAC